MTIIKAPKEMTLDLLREFPLELVLMIYKYIIMYNCVTTTDVFSLLTRGFTITAEEFSKKDPFIDTCLSIIAESELEIDYAEVTLRFKKINKTLKSMSISSGTRNDQLIEFVNCLIKSNIKFSKIFTTNTRGCEFIGRLISSCSSQLEFSKETISNYELTNYKDSITCDTLFLPTTTGAEFLLQMDHLKHLKVSVAKDQFSLPFRHSWDEDLDMNEDIQFVKQWAQLGSPKITRRKISVEFSLRSTFATAVFELLSFLENNKCLELDIHALDVDSDGLELIIAFKDLVNVLNASSCNEKPIDIAKLNKFNSINSISFTAGATPFNINNLDNSNIKKLIIDSKGLKYDISQIKNKENLEILSLSPTNYDFSFFSNLLQLDVTVQGNSKCTLITLPPRLYKLDMTLRLNTFNDTFRIGNRAQIKGLGEVKIQISVNEHAIVKCAEYASNLLQSLVDSLPDSLSKLTLYASYGLSSGPVSIRFKSLTLLKELNLNLGKKPAMNLEFPNSVEYLSLDSQIRSSSLNLPPNIRNLHLTFADLTNIVNFFENDIILLSYLSVLSVSISVSADLDLNYLLPPSLRSLELILQCPDEFRKTEYQGICIHLPFETHSNLVDITIYSLSRQGVVTLMGAAVKDRKCKLEVHPEMDFNLQ